MSVGSFAVFVCSFFNMKNNYRH